MAVCREIMAALREEDWDVRYLSADARMERSLLASLPLQRGWIIRQRRSRRQRSA